MAITQLDKILNVGHPITFQVADPSINTSTTWIGYSNVIPNTGYVNAPNPYNSYIPSSETNNIIYSTGFEDIEIGTANEYLKVPLDGGDAKGNENSDDVAFGGGFVSTNAPPVNIEVKLEDNSVDVDVTELVKWYITNNGSNSRLKILARGSFTQVGTPEIYGYIRDTSGNGLVPSESYMITTEPSGDPDEDGSVNNTAEVVVDPSRRATVEFYSFGETADFFPRFNGNYGTGNLTNTISSSDTGIAIKVLSYEPSQNQLTFTIDKTNSNAAYFIKRLKTWIFPDTDYTVGSIAFASLDGTTLVNATTLPSGPVIISNFSEDANEVIIVIGNYSPLQNTLIVPPNTILNSLNLTITRPNRNWFEIKRAITSISGQTPAGPTGEVFREIHYPNIDSGSCLYFPSGITKSSASNSPLTINSSGTKRFKVKRSIIGTGSAILEIDQNWSPTSSASQVYNISMSSGLYRPKLIITKNSG